MERRNGKLTKTAVLSAAHAAVDFACAVLFFGSVQREHIWLGMILYNACAFLLQLPVGMIADRFNRNLLVSTVGCLLVAVGFLFRSNPVLALVIAGIGNGAFHVGGGIEVLNLSEEKAGPLGVFVSPGAIGLYLGQVYAGWFHANPVAVPALMLLCGTVILLSGGKEARCESQNAPFSMETPKGGILNLALLFLVVVLRSYMGMSTAFSTGDLLRSLPSPLPGLIAVLCVAGGKAAGGFLSDRIRPVPASVLSLGLCTLILFFPVHPALLLAALFLFNMTMPITLHASAKILKGAKGMAFGLLTAALFIGAVPKFMGYPFPASGWIYGTLSGVSLFLLLAGLGGQTCRTR